MVSQWLITKTEHQKFFTSFSLTTASKRDTGQIIQVPDSGAALMENQMTGFKQKGIAAETLNSTLKLAEEQRVLADLRSDNPTIDMLLVSPERLATESWVFLSSQVSQSTKNNFVVRLDTLPHLRECLQSWHMSIGFSFITYTAPPVDEFDWVIDSLYLARSDASILVHAVLSQRAVTWSLIGNTLNFMFKLSCEFSWNLSFSWLYSDRRHVMLFLRRNSHAFSS